ncbi:MAG: sugar phosphate isomerase/epimerase [Chloroflexi bacterium]|nr:sugar phosphate isomerase/epimerase [Chloroflexota bacterium]
MKIAIQHHLLPGSSLTEQFQHAAEFGFDGVELTAWGLPFVEFGTFSDHTHAVSAAIRVSHLPVSSLCSMAKDDLVHADPAERASRLDGLVNALHYADTLGAAGVIALPLRKQFPVPDLSPIGDAQQLSEQLLVHALKEAIRQTPDAKSLILLEPLNRYETPYLKTLAHAAAICKAVGSPRVKIMADLFHMVLEEKDLPAALADNAALIGHVHLADSNRQLPGQGHTDFTACFKALRSANYDGWFALECGVTGKLNEVLPATVKHLRACWDAAQ